MKKKYKILMIVAAVMIAVGLAGVIPSVYFWAKNKTAHSQPAALANVPLVAEKPTGQPEKPPVITGKPVRLEIPSLKMDLPVIDGAYHPQTGQWDISLNKAHYALPTVQPNNERGNTLLYGHYRPEVFAHLRLVKPGAEAYVTTDNGYKFIYTFREAQTVAPADTSIFMYEGKPQLTIQTCTGIWMQNRHLHYFDFVRYEKS
jgi:LPXTG-site transpeptidase (sortase) family protein